ncbi:MAG: hypothetical protein IKS19_07835 [Clostridia bacterium]|nr:hypothetical protein [Clostridia bacterium]
MSNPLIKLLSLLLSLLFCIFLFSCTARRTSFNITGTTTFICVETPEITPPKLTLNADGTFQFTYSMFSSYLPIGRYEVSGDALTLKTDDGLYTYVFRIDGDKLIFDAARSSEIPQYAYASGAKPQQPIEDGAAFAPESKYGMGEQVKVIKNITWDIDCDGVKEDCQLRSEQVGELFFFDLYVTVNSERKYYSAYNYEFCGLSFDTANSGSDGKLRISAVTDDGEQHWFDIKIRTDDDDCSWLDLTENGEELKKWIGYWLTFPEETVNDPVSEKARFDVDGDGREELFIRYEGPTSGINTNEIALVENGAIVTSRMTNMYLGSFSVSDGRLKITVREEFNFNKTHLCDIVLSEKNGRKTIELFENGEPFEAFGEAVF